MHDLRVKMREKLGTFVSEHRLSPMVVQRAAVVAMTSFVFFIAMLLLFYFRPQIGYFLLASAFLIVQIMAITGVWLLRRHSVRVYENGFMYKKKALLWSDVAGFSYDNSEITITTKSGEKVVIPASITDANGLIRRLKGAT